MSNPRKWRAKARTTKPNARQKRNGLFLDAHPICQDCGRNIATEAHHELPKANPFRYLWRFMQALCRPCHLKAHAPVTRATMP